VVLGDDTGAISLAHNPIHHGRTKHIRLAWHYLREVVASGDVILEYIPQAASQNADFLAPSRSARRLTTPTLYELVCGAIGEAA